MAAHFSGRQVGVLLAIAIASMALTGCRHEVPVRSSIKDSPPAGTAKPVKAKKPVKKTAAAVQKAEAKKEGAKKVATDATPAKAAAAPDTKPATVPPAKTATAPAAAPAPAAPAAAPAKPAVVPAPSAATPAKQAAAPVAPPAPAASAPKAAASASPAAPVSAAATPAASAQAGPIAEGRKLFAAGKVLDARKHLTAQLQAAPADANLALAQTFDPHYVTQLKTSDAGPDLGRALQLYTTAVQSGSKDAEPDLARLRTSLGLPPK